MYPSNLSCIWLIQTASGNEGFISVTFINFAVIKDKDYLSIGYGRNVTMESTVLRLTHDGKLNTLILNSTTAWVTFVTLSNSWGFELDLQVRDEYGSVFKISDKQFV